MALGKYDQKVQFISEGTVSDGGGGTIPSRVVELSTWARIYQLRASKDIEQAQMNLPSIFRVHIQARVGFEPSIRHIFEWNGEKYQIISGPVVESVRYRTEWQFDIKKNG